MIAQQPPATGSLRHGKTATATGGTAILDAIQQGSAPRLWLCLSNADTTNGIYIRFDSQSAAEGLYLSPGAAILLTWPHVPQTEIRATAAAGTPALAWIEGRA